MKKNIHVLAALSLPLIFSYTMFTQHCEAAEGWNKMDEKWVYFDENDRPLTDEWKKSKDDWFYLSSEGFLLKNCIVTYRDSIYFVDEEGKMAKSAWVWIYEGNNLDGRFDEGWYYFGGDGKGFQAKNGRFKRKIEDKTYAFSDEGKMLVGWLDKDGRPVESEEPLECGVYYAGKDGALLTNAWLDYGSIGEGVGGSSLRSEAAGRDYSEYEKLWIYFDEKSKKVASSGNYLRQKIINGNTYGFDENGVMIPWWSRVASVSNADKSNPVSSEPARFYSGYDGGVLLKDSWFWMYPSENLDSGDYYDQEYSWWHTNGRGEVYRDRIRKINGKSYAFDGIGRMQTGFVLFDKKSHFVAQYDTDVWESSDFINGAVYGIEKADLYLFSSDEQNDGSMQTGKNIKIQLEDGMYTFGFDAGGKAYGNRNKLQKRDNTYYINGLRLDANAEYGYGVVEVEKNGELLYQVVDTSGKIVEGRKKIVKDKDGGYLLIINNHFISYVQDESKPRWQTGEDGSGFYHYDKDNKENHYWQGIIAGQGTDPSLDDIPEEIRLNF